MKTEKQAIVLPLIKGNDNNVVKNYGLFDSIIGQAEIQKKLKFFVSSHSENTPIPTMLFTGSQGLGKSFTAQKVSEAMGREIIEINCGTIETAKDFIEEVLLDKVMGDKPKTLFFDEAHQLSPEITTILLSLLNPNSKNKTYLTYKNITMEYDFSKINTIFATTDAHKMFRPLLNRCVEIYFRTYNNEELFDILNSYLPNVTMDCNTEDLAYACRGRARDAFVLSQHIKRYCYANNIAVFDENCWMELKTIFGIHSFGLNNQEINLLRILNSSNALSASGLAVRMGVNVYNIESEIEVRPKELGFIVNGTKGRYLTETGKNYVTNIENAV